MQIDVMGDTIMKLTPTMNFSWLTIFLLTLVAGSTESQNVCSRTNSFVVLYERQLQSGNVLLTGVASFIKDQGDCPAEFIGISGSSLVINVVFNPDLIQQKGEYIECYYYVTCEDNDAFRYQINIIDENDEAPVFTNIARTSLNVNEIWGVGQDVYVFTSGEVNDPDYEDTPNGNKLQLMIVSSAPEANVFDVSGNLGIKLLRYLDYEDPNRRQYNLTLQLKDQSNNFGPVHSLAINVQDGDDQPPVFTSPSYTISIPQKDLRVPWCYETQPKISASDGDLAINAPVNYSLEDSHSHFDMDCPSPGDIRLIRPLSDTNDTVYRLEIQASQRDVTDRKSKSSLYVEILRSPVLSQKIYSASIRENSPAGSVVLVINTAYSSELPVPDTDFNVNDTTYFQLAKVGKNIAQLEIKGGVTLDYETATRYVLEVSATVQGMTSESSIVTILISDTNDNYPEFKQATYLLEVDEGQTDPITWQLHIEAEDKDSGSNGLVHYYLEEGCKYFDLIPEEANNQQRSRRTVQAKVDLRGDNPTAQRTADGRALYACDVIAEDSGSPKLLSRAKVIAHVRDINDKKPVFASEVAESAQIVIGSPSGILVTCISATDGDQPGTNNSQIRFSLAGSEELEINEENGQIRTKKPIEGVSRTISVEVTAFDLGSPRQSEDMTLQVQFVEAQLIPFMFDKISYDKEVQEEAAVGFFIVNVTATVKDAALTSTRYSLLDDLVPFEIAPDTGEVTVRARLDRETRNAWTFTVTATDINLPGRTAYTTVNVRVTDINDNAPKFIRAENGTSRFEAILVENSPKGTLVACFYATDEDESNTVNSAIDYRLEGNEAGLFSIDQQTGEINLETPIERPMTVEINVRASDRGSPKLSTTAQLYVEIVEAPLVTYEFLEEHYEITVIENSEIGFVVTTVEAKVNGQVSPLTRYFLLDGGTPCDVDPISGEIKLISNIDREQRSSWTFRVAANNSNLRERRALALVTVNVTDDNDNAPVFAGLAGNSDDRLESTILEGSPAGTLIACAFATDADEQGSPNAQIEYTIEGTDSGHFVVDGPTGEIKLKETLESRQTMEINVTASDRGIPKRSTTVPLIVRVAEAPFVKFEFLEEHYETTVIENSASGFVITTVEATVNGQVSPFTQYFLPDGGIPFEINSASGEIKLTGNIDRELQSAWTFRVAANNSDLRERKTFALVHINVTDVNDNAPVFAGLSGKNDGRLESTILDGSPAGTLVACAFATDADEQGSLNAQVQYTIEGTDSGYFVIDGTTGEIKLKETLASRQPLEINVTASDRGTPKLSTTVPLYISVVEAPFVTFEFLKEQYESTVPENTEPGLIITTVEAKVDGKVSQFTQYFLPDGGIPFEVNPTSGEIKLMGIIDREKQSLWTFTVAANDSNLRERRALAMVTINVTDVNDNAPVFAGLAGNVNNRLESIVMEGSPAGTLVACAFATDADEQGSINAQIEYTIEGADSGSFNIDGATGEIKLKETLGSYITMEINVIASDRGSPKLNATVPLFVSVVEAPSVKFEFLKEQYESTAIENSQSGLIITTVEAKVDGKVSPFTQYFLPDGGIPFEVNATSGEIKLIGDIDRELQSTWTFTVAANNTNLRERRAITLVSVNVTDVNDNAPVFAGLAGNVNNRLESIVMEGSPAGTLVACAFATDADEQGSINAQIEYIIEGADSGSFNIDGATGEIKLKETLGSHPTMEIIVIASDRGSPKLNATVPLFVSVVEAPPVKFEFLKEQYESTAIENSQPGLIITTVEANVDGKVSPFTQYFLPDGGIPFEVNVTSGEIKLTGDIDRELQSTWTFTVAANNTNLRERRAVALVTINITDVNDNAPVFAGIADNDNNRLESIVMEGSPAGTLVACAFATDADEQGSINAQIEYTIHGTDSDSFDIDGTTGEIKLQETLGSRPTMEINVTASDRGSPKLSTTVPLFVSIVEAPSVTFEFLNEQYESTVIEHSEPGLLITTVEAKVNGKVSPYTRYFLPEGNIPFEINPTSGEIKLIGDIDRELRSSWTFSVAANSSNLRERRAFALISVNVTDVNDKAPVFAGLAGSETLRLESIVLEGSPAGTLIACAFATDDDEPGSANAQIEYTMEGTDSGLFTFDGSTGEIKLKDTLGSRPTIEINVTASDRGSPKLSTTVPLFVSIVEAPSVTFEFLNEQYESTVIENSAPGHSIATVEAKVNGKVSPFTRYYLPDGGIPFEVNSISGEIKLIGDIDREIRSSWRFQVFANDSNLRDRRAFTMVSVNVTDENDNAPVFAGLSGNSNNRLESTVLEGSPAGTLVACAFATDADEQGSRNAQIEYTIEGTGSGHFTVDGATGEIKLNKKLESRQTLELNVTASDRGSPSLSTTVSLLMRVAEAPLVTFNFLEEHYETTVVENSAPGSVVTTVKATVNGQVSPLTQYFLPDGGIPFEVNPASGVITLTGDVDRELRSAWTFRVAANHSDLRERRAFALVTIIVADENDNSPVFRGSDSGTHAEFRGTTYKSAKYGTLVACIYAEDADEQNTNNSLVHYSLSDTEFLDIDPASGKVFVAASLTEAPVTIIVDVIAADHGKPQMNSTATLIVIVEKTDVIEILFEKTQYNANLTETSASGDELVTVAALVNGTVSETTIYSIPGAPLPFTLNQTTGSLRLSDKEEAFSRDFWSFLVTATDARASQITAFTWVQVQVLSALPVFPESSYYHADVPEEKEPPIDVMVIKARSSGGRQIVYKLVSQLSELPFEIDSETGQLRSRRKLDREQTPSFLFKVWAKYADNTEEWRPSFYREVNVRIDVTDTNDNSPKFGSEKQRFTIDGDAKSGAILGTVQATDADECVNIVYRMSPEGNKFFTINDVSGVITLRSSEYIPARIYTFTVTAQDYCGANSSEAPRHATDQTIEVEVVKPLTYGVPMDCFDWTNPKVVQERQGNLSNIISMDVVIHDVQPSVTIGNECMQAMVYAIDKINGTFVSREKLKAAVESKKKAIEEAVGGGQQQTATQAPQEAEKDAAIYIVAALAAVLGVACIALTATVCRRRYPKSSPTATEDGLVAPTGGRTEPAQPRVVPGTTAMSNSGYAGSNGNVSTPKGTSTVQNGSAAPNGEQAALSRSQPSGQPAEATRSSTANDAAAGGSLSSGVLPSPKVEVASSPAVPFQQAHPPDTTPLPQIIIQPPDTGSIHGSSETVRSAADNETTRSPRVQDADTGTTASGSGFDGTRSEQPSPSSTPKVHGSVAIEMDGRNGEQSNNSASADNDSTEELSAL